MTDEDAELVKWLRRAVYVSTSVGPKEITAKAMFWRAADRIEALRRERDAARHDLIVALHREVSDR